MSQAEQLKQQFKDALKEQFQTLERQISPFQRLASFEEKKAEVTKTVTDSWDRFVDSLFGDEK